MPKKPATETVANDTAAPAKGKKTEKTTEPKGKKSAALALAGDKPAKEKKPKEAKAEIVKVEALPPGVTEEGLNGQVQAVLTLKGDAVASHWKLGAEIKVIFDTQSWKARRTAAGGPVYKSFESFCRAELVMSHTNAYSLMDLARCFTEEQVRAFGPSKLGLILQAPADAQPALLEMAEKGASKREVKAAVKDVKEEKKAKTGDDSKRKTGRKETPKGKQQESKTVAKSDAISIALVEGKKTIPLFIKPEKKTDEPKRAKKVSEIPWGSVDLANSIRCFFVVKTDPNGHLFAEVNFKRIDALPQPGLR